MSSIATGAGLGKSWIAPVITLALTVTFAALSYRFVEQPVRRVGLRGALVRWLSPRSYTPRRKKISIALAAVVAITFPLTGIAVAIAPAQTSSEDSIRRGQEMLEADRGNEATKSEEAPGATTDGDTADGDTASPEGVTPPITIEGRDVSAVGDSVMLASYPELTEAFPGIEVDAAVSRGMWAGVDIVTGMAAQGTLREVVVVGLGTNGPVEAEALEALKDAVGDRRLVLVDAHAERDWIADVNADLTAFAEAHRGVTLARWDAAVAGTPEFLAEDGIHPGPEGGETYAASIRAALDELLSPGESAGWSTPRR